jgi:hypothetical protein
MKGKVGCCSRIQTLVKFHQLGLLERIARFYRPACRRWKRTKRLGVFTGTILEAGPPIHAKARIQTHKFTQQHILIEMHIMRYDKIYTANNGNKLWKDG